MSKILISPYPARLHSGIHNAKSFPSWDELVLMLKENGHEIIQIGVQGEVRIVGVDQFVINWPFDKLKTLMESCDTFISVDSWFPHFVHYHRLKRGVVLWGKSDHRVWGYPENENLLAGEEHLREFQYQDWETIEHDPRAFVPPKQVIWAVERILDASNTPSRPADRLAAIQGSSELAVT